MAEIFEIQVSVLADPASAKIAELQKQLNELTKTKEINIKLNIDKSTGLSNIGKEIDSLSKKIKTTVSDTKISPQLFDISKQSTQLENINQKYRELKEIGVDATSSVNLLKQAFDQLQGAQTIDEYNKSLSQFNAQINIIKQDFKDLIPKDILDVSTLSNKIEVWMSNNKRAAKEFATELQQVNQLLSGDTVDVGSYNQANKMFKEITSSAKAMGIEGESAGEKFGKMFAKFSQWFGITRIIMEAVNTIKQMTAVIIEIDAGMTELKKVTSETDAVYAKFLDGASERANKFGATIADVVTATADWAKLGYGIQEASELADASILYKNVADGIEDVSTASASIVSTMKANFKCLCVQKCA